MTTNSLCEDVAPGLVQTIEFLNDLQDALNNNSYVDEAHVVSMHLEQLRTPETESRLHSSGMSSIMEELSRSFE